MTILEKIKFEEDWLSEVNLTKENVRIAIDSIKATALESQKTAHFISFENLNYSPFDNSPKVLLKCSECGNAVLSMFAYCPMCGRKLEEGEKNEK